MFISYYFLLICFLSTVICELNIHVEYRENNSIKLFYNLTSNYSYLITVRLFGDEQMKFGVYPPTNKFEENFIEIFQRFSSKDLLIICFHFIQQINNLDIQCQDLSISKNNENQSNPDFLPSYHPFFVPMMYGLSILMLLPVIIQHHRQKKTQLIERRKELRRLSVSISQDKQNPQQKIAQKMLSELNENGTINYDHIPFNLDLVSIPSSKTILEDLDDNPSMGFTLKNLQPYISKDYIRKSSTEINAHDCIAHLLDHTPWNNQNIDQPLIKSLSKQSVIRDCPTAIREQHVPIIISLEDDKIPMFVKKKFSKDNLHQINQGFIESDV